jgi:hypothetical protein
MKTDALFPPVQVVGAPARQLIVYDCCVTGL